MQEQSERKKGSITGIQATRLRISGPVSVKGRSEATTRSIGSDSRALTTSTTTLTAASREVQKIVTNSVMTPAWAEAFARECFPKARNLERKCLSVVKKHRRSHIGLTAYQEFAYYVMSSHNPTYLSRLYTFLMQRASEGVGAKLRFSQKPMPLQDLRLAQLAKQMLLATAVDIGKLNEESLAAEVHTPTISEIGHAGVGAWKTILGGVYVTGIQVDSEASDSENEDDAAAATKTSDQIHDHTWCCYRTEDAFGEHEVLQNVLGGAARCAIDDRRTNKEPPTVFEITIMRPYAEWIECKLVSGSKRTGSDGKKKRDYEEDENEDADAQETLTWTNLKRSNHHSICALRAVKRGDADGDDDEKAQRRPNATFYIASVWDSPRNAKASAMDMVRDLLQKATGRLIDLSTRDILDLLPEFKIFSVPSYVIRLEADGQTIHTTNGGFFENPVVREMRYSGPVTQEFDPGTLEIVDHSWYTYSGNQLARQIDLWMRKVTGEDTDEFKDVPRSIAASSEDAVVRALLVPHAAHRYSGSTAAFAFARVDPAAYDRVFILAPLHSGLREPPAGSQGYYVSAFEEYATPLGRLRIDPVVHQVLLESQDAKFAVCNSGAELGEHSLEVQLPFIAYAMSGASYRIVPILLDHLTEEAENACAQALAPFVANPRNLFVVSSDFCHWGKRFKFVSVNVPEAIAAGAQTKSEVITQSILNLDIEAQEAIATGDPQDFAQYLRKYENPICGRHAISVMLKAFRAANVKPEFKVAAYHLSNAPRGLTDSAVGYTAAVWET